MPNILNIGMTLITPEQKIDYINELYGLWRPPTPYKCEFAKRVLHAEHKKNTIYKLILQSRVNPNQKFFRITIEEVRTLFDLMDGDNWINSKSISDDIYDIPMSVNNTDNDDILEKKKELDMLSKMCEKKEIEIKTTEERMLDCLFKKCDDLDLTISNKKAELSELNTIIEESKAALRQLTNDSELQDINNKHITEY
jgi:hypothetical protein